MTTGSTPAVWEFLVISRRELAEWHEREGFGTCHNYQLLVSVTFRPTSVLGHERDLQPWRNRWERYWPAL